jgi:hypothetical protein
MECLRGRGGVPRRPAPRIRTMRPGVRVDGRVAPRPGNGSGSSPNPNPILICYLADPTLSSPRRFDLTQSNPIRSFTAS